MFAFHSFPGLRRTLTATIGGLLLLLSAGSSVADDGPRGADWISTDAVVYLEITRPSGVLDRLTGEPVRGLLESSPDFQKTLNSNSYREGRGVVEAIAGTLGTTWDQALLNIAGGGLVLAIEPTEPPRYYLIATPRDPAFLAKAVQTIVTLARTDATLKKQPEPFQEADHRGIKGYVIGLAAAYAIVDGTLVFADSRASLNALIDRTLDRPEATRMLPANPLWQAQRLAHQGNDPVAWGLVRLDRIRQTKPNALAIPAMVNPLLTILFADWVESARKAPWVSASLTWTTERLAANLTLANPPGGYSELYRRFVPAKGKGAPSLVLPKGTIASLGLWRDLSSVWEVRSDLFPPEVIQGFAQLDTVAGTFFAGRDFGTGVLGALGTDWRLIVARQDPATLDPKPDDKLPAFALIADLKPDDEEFAARLKSAFQTFVGLFNLSAAQPKAPPLMLGSETVDGVMVATSRFLKPKAAAKAGEPVHSRHNFSPSIAQVGDHFIISSSVGLIRDLIPAMKQPLGPANETLRIAANGGELATLVEENRPRLVMQNMLEKGNDKPRAETEIALLSRILQTLGRGNLSALDTKESVQLRIDFAIQNP